MGSAYFNFFNSIFYLYKIFSKTSFHKSFEIHDTAKTQKSLKVLPSVKICVFSLQRTDKIFRLYLHNIHLKNPGNQKKICVRSLKGYSLSWNLAYKFVFNKLHVCARFQVFSLNPRQWAEIWHMREILSPRSQLNQRILYFIFYCIN